MVAVSVESLKNAGSLAGRLLRIGRPPINITGANHHVLSLLHAGVDPNVRVVVRDLLLNVAGLTAQGWDPLSVLHHVASLDAVGLQGDLQTANERLKAIKDALTISDTASAVDAIEFLKGMVGELVKVKDAFAVPDDVSISDFVIQKWQDAKKQVTKMGGLLGGIRSILGLGDTEDPLAKIQSLLRDLGEAQARIAEMLKENGLLRAENETLRYLALGGRVAVDMGDGLTLGKTYVSEGEADFFLKGNHFAFKTGAAGRTGNQDAFGFLRLYDGCEVFVVGDGMGGGADGGELSKIAVQAFLDAMSTQLEMPEAARNAGGAVLDAIYQKYQTYNRHKDDGTTLVALALDRQKNEIRIIIVGDSRVKMVTPDRAALLAKPQHSKYAFFEAMKPGRPVYGSDPTAPNTIPDAVADEVDQIRSTGALTMGLTSALAGSNVDDVGNRRDPVLIDYVKVPIKTAKTPTVLLLYSDGVVEKMKESELTAVVRGAGDDPEAIAEAVFAAAMQSRTGDNVTVTVIVLPFELETGNIVVTSYPRSGAH